MWNESIWLTLISCIFASHRYIPVNGSRLHCTAMCVHLHCTALDQVSLQSKKRSISDQTMTHLFSTPQTNTNIYVLLCQIFLYEYSWTFVHVNLLYKYIWNVSFWYKDPNQSMKRKKKRRYSITSPALPQSDSPTDLTVMEWVGEPDQLCPNCNRRSKKSKLN